LSMNRSSKICWRLAMVSACVIRSFRHPDSGRFVRV
jgi:hypothetical protein